MKILVGVRVLLDGGCSEDTTIEITKKDIEALAQQKALELIEGLSASTLGIEIRTTFSFCD